MRIDLVDRAPELAAESVDLYAIAADGARSRAPRWVATVPKETRRGLALELDASSTEGLILFGEGVWSPLVEPVEGAARFEIEPGGLATFEVAKGSGEDPELPPVVLARAWRRAAEEPAEVSVLCRRPKDKQIWTCATPPGRLDLRVDFPGFAPAFLWDVDAPPGGAPEVLDLRLVRGARVEAWTDVDTGTGRLRPAGRRWEISEDRTRFASQEAAVAPGGRLAFDNVPPGRHRLEVASAGHGRTALDVVVAEGQVSLVLEDIRLRAPERVEIQLDPPVDGSGEPWLVSLSGVETEIGSAVKRVTLDLTGYGTVEDLVPGRYYLTVKDSKSSVWHLAAHAVDAAAGPLSVSIPHVPVEGRIRVGDEALEATLVFGTTQGARQLRFRSDERGRFRGYLPEEGLWEVELGDEESGCNRCGGDLGVTLLPPVEVEIGPSGKALLDIALPDTLVEGRVVRGPPGQGEPVAGAQVIALRPGGPPDRSGRLAQLWTDDEGRFALRGIEAGPMTIGARLASGEGESSWTELEVRERLELPELELRIEDKVPVLVRIVHGGRPVPGARIHALPEHAPSTQATTGLDGRATLQVPAGAAGSLLVDPPGLALGLERFQSGEGPESLRTVEAAAATGALLLEGLAAPPLHGLLMRGEAAVSLHVLRNFAPDRVRTIGAGVVLAGLGAGEYSICPRPPSDCRSLTVLPATTTTLNRDAWEGTVP